MNARAMRTASRIGARSIMLAVCPAGMEPATAADPLASKKGDGIVLAYRFGL